MRRTVLTRGVLTKGVLATGVVGLLLAGCGGDDPADPAQEAPATSTTTTTTAPPSSSEPPLAASPELPQGLVAQTTCQPLDARLQTAIDDSFREAGSELTAAQMLASPDGTIYAGGDVLLPDGTPGSEAEVWVFPVAGQALFSVSPGAIEQSEWPDGRDALGMSADDETGTALAACVAAAR